MFDISKVTYATLRAHAQSSEAMGATVSFTKAERPAPPHVLRAYAVHDGLIRFIMPLCSSMTDRPEPGVAITQQIVIADISGIGVSQVWQIKSHLQTFSQVLAQMYPEILDRVLVGTPSLFS